MISFESDYIAGAHPQVMKRLMETNLENTSGYGSDPYSESAAEKIRRATGCPDASVYFLVGGTQTNQVVISTVLQNFEGVVAARTGHVSIHEAGAIEYTGHKVLELPSENGKMKADDLKAFIDTFYADGNHEHMVFPGMVYISYPTEYGTLYTKKELTDIYDICQKCELPLFIDGARLGYGLESHECDITLPELAGLCDVFYIGGTKVGAFCGEAVVFPRGNEPKHFITQVKQHGALLAKGKLTGVQFDTLFTDNLYFKISRHAIDMAKRLKNIFETKGYSFFMSSPTNQQFIIFDNETAAKLSENVKFSFWEKYDSTHTVYRFATSWSTTESDLDELEKLI